MNPGAADVVVCSNPLLFQCRDRAAMTERMPWQQSKTLHTQIHRSPHWTTAAPARSYRYDMEKCWDACAKHGVAMECNSYRGSS